MLQGPAAAQGFSLWPEQPGAGRGSVRRGHTRVLARGTAWAGPGKLWTVIIKINLPITPLGA